MRDQVKTILLIYFSSVCWLNAKGVLLIVSFWLSLVSYSPWNTKQNKTKHEKTRQNKRKEKHMSKSPSMKLHGTSKTTRVTVQAFVVCRPALECLPVMQRNTKGENTYGNIFGIKHQFIMKYVFPSR